jgi:hypothetical protein
VIGITWPSLWRLADFYVVPPALVTTASFSAISVNADEIGDTVGSYILQKILNARMRSAPETSIALIGHSFGARVLVHAIEVGWKCGVDPMEKEECSDAERNDRGFRSLFGSKDSVIFLQGAFRIARLFSRPDWIVAEPWGRGAPRVTMTASRHDTAVTKAIWAYYPGDIESFDAACREDYDVWDYTDFGELDTVINRPKAKLALITCDVAKRQGRYGFNLCNASVAAPLPFQREGAKLRYVDASDMINCNEPFTSGGAHSDIFRSEVARFLMDEIP